MVFVGTNNYFLRSDIVADYNTVCSRKIFRSIKVFGELISLLYGLGGFYTVKTIKSYIVIMDIMRQDIPTVLKQLYTIGLDEKSVAMRLFEGTVCYIDDSYFSFIASRIVVR